MLKVEGARRSRACYFFLNHKASVVVQHFFLSLGHKEPDAKQDKQKYKKLGDDIYKNEIFIIFSFFPGFEGKLEILNVVYRVLLLSRLILLSCLLNF